MFDEQSIRDKEAKKEYAVGRRKENCRWAACHYVHRQSSVPYSTELRCWAYIQPHHAVKRVSWEYYGVQDTPALATQ